MATRTERSVLVLETAGSYGEAWRNAREQPAQHREKGDFHVLFAALDALGQCLAFHDHMGRLQYATQAYIDTVNSSGPTGEPVRSQVSQLAQAVSGMAKATRAGTARYSDARTIRTACGEYQIQAVFVGAGMLAGSAGVLTIIVAPPLDPRAGERLCAQFRLTRAQIRVARLLIQGLRNAEIAQRLFLSEHTVRHHLEQIRRKVGGHTRAAIAARLQERA